MSNAIVPQLYRDIVQRVIDDVREDFDQYGVDESVLEELRVTWEKKLYESGVADFGSIDLGDDYYGEAYEEEYPQAIGTVAGSNNVSSRSNGAANSMFPFHAGGPGFGHFQAESRPAAYMAPPSSSQSSQPKNPDKPAVTSLPNPVIPQFDGMEDKEFDEDLINSDLDDENDESDEEAEAESTNMMLCQYEKVNRTKNKWKCLLRDGIVHVNGRDYAFSKANGDFQF